MRRRVGEAELGYEVRGQGAALVLLHAFPFDRRLWDEVLPQLARTRRVIAIDLRGFGESTLSPRPASIDDLADDLAGLLDGLGVPMAAVLGISMGGYVALAFERRHPARTAALILCDSRLTGETAESRLRRDQAMLEARRDPAGFASRFALSLLGRDSAAELRERVCALARQPGEAMAQALAAMRERAAPSLEEIGAPTLVLVGDRDPLISVEQASTWAAAIPGARFGALAGAGHLPPLESPASLSVCVSAFLDDIYD